MSCARHDENLWEIKCSLTSKNLQSPGEARVWAWGKVSDSSEMFREHHTMTCKCRILIGKVWAVGRADRVSVEYLLDGKHLVNVTFFILNKFLKERILSPFSNWGILHSVFQQTVIYLSLKFMLISLGYIAHAQLQKEAPPRGCRDC